METHRSYHRAHCSACGAGIRIYEVSNVVSTFVSEHPKAGSTARVGASSVPEGLRGVIRGVQSWSPNGVQNAFGVQMESKSFSRKSCVFISMVCKLLIRQP